MTNFTRSVAIPMGPAGSGRSVVTWAGIRGVIMDRISNGTYPPGTLIPTEQQFAAEFGSARATVNRALTSLAERGVLERRRRVGTRVVLGLEPEPERPSLPVIRDMIEERGWRFDFRYLGSLPCPVPPQAPGEPAERLFRSDPADLRELRTLLYCDGRLFCAERRWIDSAALPQLTDDLLRTVTANEWLAHNTPLTLIERLVSARGAGEVGADQLLRCPPEAPLLVQETTLWVGARPLSWTQHSFAPEFRMDLSRAGDGVTLAAPARRG